MGTQRAMKLSEDLIENIRLEQAKEDAELAKRPNAAEIGGTLQKRLAAALEREKQLRERVNELDAMPWPSRLFS